MACLGHVWLSGACLWQSGAVCGRLKYPWGATSISDDHWQETEVVNNETKKLEAVKNILRDFYIGLDNRTKPYYDGRKDTTG